MFSRGVAGRRVCPTCLDNESKIRISAKGDNFATKWNCAGNRYMGDSQWLAVAYGTGLGSKSPLVVELACPSGGRLQWYQGKFLLTVNALHSKTPEK